MAMIRGRIRAGRVELDRELPEGSEFVVIPADEIDDQEVFVVSGADAEELDARAAEPEHTDLSAEEVIRRLRLHASR